MGDNVGFFTGIAMFFVEIISIVLFVVIKSGIGFETIVGFVFGCMALIVFIVYNIVAIKLMLERD